MFLDGLTVILIIICSFALLGIYWTIKSLKTFIRQRFLQHRHGYQTSTLRPADQRLKDYARYLLDKVPFPTWIRRGKNLELVYCNAAYAAALETSPQEVVEGNLSLSNKELGTDGLSIARKALSSDTALTETHTIVLKGQRKLVEFTEIPVVDGSAVVGFAIDHSPIEQLQRELDRHIAAHNNILGYLNNAIAIYGPDKHLQFYNKAFIQLWKLDKEFLDTEPRFEDVLEELRTQRRIPEQADFPTYKRDLAAQFQKLLSPRQELLHLPDERTIRQTTLPHPMGGLVFVFENVTDNISLKRQNTVLSETFEASLNAIKHPIMVLNADKLLTFANTAASQFFDISMEAMAKRKTPVTQVFEAIDFKKKPESMDSLLAALDYKDAMDRPYNETIMFRTEKIPYGNTILQIRV